MELVAPLNSIDTVVGAGKAVISADNSVIVAMMQAALRQGRSATFYVSREQGQALMRWYWTPGRIKEIGMEPVSKEENGSPIALNAGRAEACMGCLNSSNRASANTIGIGSNRFWNSRTPRSFASILP
jgi:hypothetical protein